MSAPSGEVCLFFGGFLIIIDARLALNLSRFTKSRVEAPLCLR